MEHQTIKSLDQAALQADAMHRIQLQANYIGLQNNYATGDKVNIMLEEQIYEVTFDKEAALKENLPLSCSKPKGFLQQYPVKNSREGREVLARLLELDTPVSEAVFFAVVHDEGYFQNLIVSRTTPAFLDKLLQNPPEIAMDEEVLVPEKTTGQLVAKAAKSMFDWTKTGFSKVDDLTYERRMAACLGCKFLKDPPDTLAYKVASLSRKERAERKICGMCGCLVANKAKLPHESCPASHAELEGMNRWAEPMA